MKASDYVICEFRLDNEDYRYFVYHAGVTRAVSCWETALMLIRHDTAKAGHYPPVWQQTRPGGRLSNVSDEVYG